MLDYDPIAQFDRTDPFSEMYNRNGRLTLQEKEVVKDKKQPGIGNYDILAKGMKTYRMPESKIDVSGLYRRDNAQMPLGEYHVMNEAFSARIRDEAYSAQMKKAEFTRKYNIQSH